MKRFLGGAAKGGSGGGSPAATPKGKQAANSSPAADDGDAETPEENPEEDANAIASRTLDKASERNFLDQFASLPEKTSDTVRFFDRKDYYTVHGDDATFVAQELFKTMTAVKYWGASGAGGGGGSAGSSGLASLNVSPSNFESFVRELLLERRHKVEIWTSDRGKWSATSRASPGHLDELENILFRGEFEMSESSVMCAVKVITEGGQWVVGIAYVDATARRLGVSEFLDNDQFTNLEAALVRLSAKECLVIGDQSSECKKVHDVLERCEVAATERKRADFATNNVEQDLVRLLGVEAPKIPQLDMKHAMSAAAAVVKYLELCADESNHGRFALVELELERFMKLDSAAVRALNLLPQPGDANRNMSVYGLLNKCKSAIGSRLLMQWVKQPLLDKAEIESRLDLVELLVDDTELRLGLQETHLRHVPDLGRLSRKFLRRAGAKLEDAFRLYQFVLQLPGLRALLAGASGGAAAELDRVLTAPLGQVEADFANFVNMIEQTIDLEAVKRHEFVIAPRYDPGLQAIADAKEELMRAMEKEVGKIAKDLALDKDKVKLENNSVHNHYARIARKDEKVLRNNKAYTTLETRKDGVRFTTPALRQASTQYREKTDAYNKQQGTLIDSAIAIVASYCPAIEELAELIARLDVFVALAHVAAAAPTAYARPTLTPAGVGSVVLKGCRHPCLEVMDDVNFIPNDVELKRGTSEFQIVTGPNMGGKSTYIRQIGVSVLLAQIGSFVPCDSAEVCITHAILARIGASDNQLRGVSTFMSEMLETANILQAADSRSLIIVDELGRGTSTYDGFGLAWAISEHIATNIHALTLFATHFHELTELERVLPVVANRHVSAHIEGGELTMLYTVQPGACDHSFGIHVAELAKFPAKVVADARRKAQELESFERTIGAGGDAAVAGAEPAAKKARSGGEGEGDDEEGRRLVLQFLRDFAKMPMDTLTPQQACEGLAGLKATLTGKGNAFVSRVLAAPSAGGV